MGSFRQLLYHIILTPYKREPVFRGENRIRLYKYISTVSKNLGCPIYAINGMNNHIHILVSIKHDILVSEYIKKIKVSSSIFIKEAGIFSYFKKWAVGYSIFSCSYSAKEKAIEYIQNQEEHHRRKSLYDEINDLLNENGLLDRSTTPYFATNSAEATLVKKASNGRP
jgi:REP element-mobilizing transposase RayT